MELAVVVAVVVAEQIDLDQPGSGVVPGGPGFHRDRGLQQAARFGMDGPCRDEQALQVGLEVAVHGGW